MSGTVVHDAAPYDKDGMAIFSPMHRTEPGQEYDVVIIGSGIGGLTAGAILSKAGMKVCLLEKEPHPGGYLAGFRRKDFRFDTAIHWLNQFGEDGMLSRIFNIIGNDYPHAGVQQRIRRFKGDHHDYLLTNRPDELKEQWKKEFPEDADGIDRFFAAARKLGEAFKNFSPIFRSEETMGTLQRLANKRNLLKFGLPFIPHLRYAGEKGIKKGLAKYFTNKKLLEVFSADTEILSCLVPIGWAYFNDFQTPPAGGGQVIAEWLEHVIHFFKQEIHYRCEVKQILTQGKKVRGVYCTRGSREFHIKSNWVIAACDTPALYNKMLPPELVPAKLKKNLGTAELYSSSLTISIALDCPVENLGFNQEMIHISSAKVPLAEHTGGDPLRTEISILAPSFRDPTLAPKGYGTLLIFMPASIAFEQEWRTEKDAAGNYIRGEAYKELKEQMAQQLIDRVERIVAPGLRKHILFYEVATPITHWRYTGNTGGSMMATKPNRPNMVNKVATYHTPVEHLLIGGHWAELGGGVPIAAKAGANASLLVLKKEKPAAFKALSAYMDSRYTVEQLQQSGAFAHYPDNWVQDPTPAEKSALRREASK